MNVEIMASPTGTNDGFPPPPTPDTVPLVERPDFLEGSIDALEEILERYGDLERKRDAFMYDGVDPEALGPLVDELHAEAGLLGTMIREALQQARWKLARVQKAQVQP